MPPRTSGRSPRSTPGVYAFDGRLLAQALGKLTTQNDQGEEYLTDVIALLVDSGSNRGRARDRRPDRGARLQRPGRAGRPRGAPSGPDQHGVDAGRRHDRRPDDDLDRRDGHARPRHRDRARIPSCAGRPSIGRRRGGRAPTPRSIDVYVGDGRAGGPGPRGRRHASGPGRLLDRSPICARHGAARAVEGRHLRGGEELRGRRRHEDPASVLCGRRNDRRGDEHRRRPTWSSTTTGSRSTARSSVPMCGPGPTRCWWHPVTVGDGAYTAAGSVITKDVPPGALGGRLGRSSATSRAGWSSDGRARRPQAAAEAAARRRRSAGSGGRRPAGILGTSARRRNDTRCDTSDRHGAMPRHATALLARPPRRRTRLRVILVKRLARSPPCAMESERP